MRKKYNYFDDEPEYKESAFNKIKNKAVIYAVCAYDALKDKGIIKRASHSAAGGKIKNVIDRKGALLNFTAFLLFIIAIGCIVMVFISNVNKSNDSLRKYYSDAGRVCSEVITSYGSCKTAGADRSKDLWQMNGLCYIRQLDFDNDESDELLIAYNNGGTYYAEVWGYNKNDFVKYYSSPVNNIETDDFSGSFITVYCHGGKYYLGILDNEDNTKINMLQLKNGEFKETNYSCEYDAVNDIYAIKGKMNSTDFETIKLSYISASKAERLVDIVNSNLDSFITEKDENKDSQKTDPKSAAYYSVIAKRIEKYGKPVYEEKDNIYFAKGTAVVRLIDFDADGNEELLIISKRTEQESKSSKKASDEYRLEVYGWQNEQAVKLFENDGISRMKNKENDDAFYILRLNENGTADICSNSYSYGKRSDKMWSATSKIVSMENGEFSTAFYAYINCQYGEMSYTIDDKSVYRTEFNKRGYQVPYFCNEDDYDENEFEITKLQGTADDINSIKNTVSETNKTITKLNPSYIAG